MAGYPETGDERRFDADALRRTVAQVFVVCGMTGDDAELLADSLVAADLRGIHSHGVLRVPEYVAKLRGGGVDPRGKPQVVRDRAAALVVDGGNSMGQIGASFAMQKAIGRARETSVAAAAVSGSNHCGAMDYFARMALKDGMIGLATTNALPTMAPWGGRDKIVGINPLAVAIPAAEQHPIVFDAAFSASSHGKLRVYHQKGLPIPDGWAFDRLGQPTTDAAAAIEGLLRPIGGYKGTGLAMITGILSSLLSRAAYGTELGNMVDGPRPGRDGHFLMAINVAAFEDEDRFRQRVDRIVVEIQSSNRAPGVDKLYAPGGLEAETESRYRREGIPLNRVTLEGLSECTRTLGVHPI